MYRGQERCIRHFGEDTDGRRPLGITRHRWEDNITMDVKEVE
jgi:hypothetical protein